MDTLAAGGGEDHEHCKNCIRMRCTVKPAYPDSCAMIDCAMRCGMRLHKCKQVEHLEVCQAHRVPCINLEAGCPHILPRRDLGRHLEVCPASVIHCTVEWNRWPVYSAERQARVPFVQDNLHAKYGQLDVALALRDQRVLNEAMKAPRSTRRALRNPLTQRFPAVPLTSKFSTSQIEPKPLSSDVSHMSDEDSDAPWEVRKNPPGLERSICNELFKATRQITESLSAAISVTTDPPAPHMLAEVPEGYEQSEEHNETMEAMESEKDIEGHMHNDEMAKTFSDGIKALEDGITKAAAKLKQGSVKISDEDQAMEHPGDSRFNLQINLKSERTRITDVNGLSHSQPPKKTVPIPPPVPTITLKQILALDLNIESITRYQAKPKSMYTFLCAQQFRRDEYSWHFKNVHSDIHGGLSGWLEHRCPLAHYGCTYSARRLHPSPKGSKLVHNNIIEAFGVQPHVPIEHQINKDEYPVVSDDGERYSQTQQQNSLSTPKNIVMRNHGLKHNTKESTPEILTSKDYDSVVQINGNAELVQNADADDEICDSKEEMRNSYKLLETDNEEVMVTGESTNYTEDHTDNIPQDEPNCDMLTSLPFEVLTHIAKFLDPFSLGNVALTSKYLREVACSLLENRGIVLLHWEKQRSGQKFTWQTIYKRWMFSTAFTPVQKWGFEDYPHMGNHLQECPFNRTAQHEGPVLLPSMESDDHTQLHVQDALKRMYPDFVTYQQMMENTLESRA